MIGEGFYDGLVFTIEEANRRGGPQPRDYCWDRDDFGKPLSDTDQPSWRKPPGGHEDGLRQAVVQHYLAGAVRRAADDKGMKLSVFLGVESGTPDYAWWQRILNGRLGITVAGMTRLLDALGQNAEDTEFTGEILMDLSRALDEFHATPSPKVAR